MRQLETSLSANGEDSIMMRNEAGHLSPQASGHMHLTII
jgi:hypothetical protein